jgi:hypothetical protein
VTDCRTVAIMQPTYLPWIGYFAMVDRVDEFIFLDSVQFARRSWQQRNRIKTLQGELLLTIPVFSRGQREQRIADVRIDVDSGFARKHWRAIEESYGKTRYFTAYSQTLEPLYSTPVEQLATFTINLVVAICRLLHVTTPTHRSSLMNASGSKASLLANLCREAGACRYLSAPGSSDYIEQSDAFRDAGIALEYHHYDHPRYEQLGPDFLPNLSIIDLLFNVGGERALEILRSGVRGAPR